MEALYEVAVELFGVNDVIISDELGYEMILVPSQKKVFDLEKQLNRVASGPFPNT